jgi:hypothetical protein
MHTLIQILPKFGARLLFSLGTSEDNENFNKNTIKINL